MKRWLETRVEVSWGMVVVIDVACKEESRVRLDAAFPCSLKAKMQRVSVLRWHSSLDAFAAVPGSAFAFSLTLAFTFAFSLTFALHGFGTSLRAAFHAATVGEGGWNGCDESGDYECDECVFHCMWR